LNEYRKKTKEKCQNKKCLFCPKEETTSHLMLECENFELHRKDLRKAIAKTITSAVQEEAYQHQTQIPCWFGTPKKTEKTKKITWTPTQRTQDVKDVFLLPPPDELSEIPIDLREVMKEINTLILKSFYKVWLIRNAALHTEFQQRKANNNKRRKQLDRILGRSPKPQKQTEEPDEVVLPENPLRKLQSQLEENKRKRKRDGNIARITQRATKVNQAKKRKKQQEDQKEYEEGKRPKMKRKRKGIMNQNKKKQKK